MKNRDLIGNKRREEGRREEKGKLSDTEEMERREKGKKSYIGNR